MSAAPISLVITVLNEGAAIETLLASIAAQTRPPTEVIIVDGGSTDATLPWLREWQARLPLQVLSKPGANISQGRNAGIAAAQGPLIAVTDAGVWLPPTWLADLVAPFTAPKHGRRPTVVAGFFVPAPQTVFERAMGATVLPALDEIDPATFLPSSRSLAMYKEAWVRARGYPEWLDYCEDLIFDLRLRQQAEPTAFAPTAQVWFRPRGSFRAFWHQYFRYARGDGKAGLFARRHAIRYGTYIGLLASIGYSRRYPIVWPLLLVAGSGYLRRPYLRLRPWLAPLSLAERGQALSLPPLIRLVGDLAKMAGYPCGLVWRWRRYGFRRDWRTIHDTEAGQ